MTYLTNNWMHN